MEFFLKIIYQWLADNNISYVLYGSDGSKLNSYKSGSLPDQFIPEEKSVRSSPFPIGFVILLTSWVNTAGVGASSMMDGM